MFSGISMRSIIRNGNLPIQSIVDVILHRCYFSSGIQFALSLSACYSTFFFFPDLSLLNVIRVSNRSSIFPKTKSNRYASIYILFCTSGYIFNMLPRNIYNKEEESGYLSVFFSSSGRPLL
jgi:hypothetical protein